MNVVLFLVLAALIIASSLVVILHRNPVYSALGLVGTLFLLAVFFLGLEAQMVAVLQIIVYAGAIVVLFLFVVMLLNVPTEDPPTGYHARILGGAGPRRFGAVLSIVLIAEFGWAMTRLDLTPMPSGQPGAATTVYDIGIRLFTKYSFAFEATSVLILVAMVGAIVLARKEHA